MTSKKFIWSDKQLVQNNLNVSAPINRIANNKCRLNSLRVNTLSWSYLLKTATLIRKRLSCPFFVFCQWINVIKAGCIFIYWHHVSANKINQQEVIQGHLRLHLRIYTTTFNNVNHKDNTTRQKPYLNPYSNITAAGSPFPTATMNSFSYLDNTRCNH